MSKLLLTKYTLLVEVVKDVKEGIYLHYFRIKLQIYENENNKKMPPPDTKLYVGLFSHLIHLSVQSVLLRISAIIFLSKYL